MDKYDATRPFAVLAAGGTGGHLFPAQAIKEALCRAGYDVHLTTDARGVRYADGFESHEITVLPTGSFSQGSWFKRLSVPFLIFRGVLMAWRLFSARRPRFVIGFGGYPALPALAVARLRGIPYYIHEQNAVLGRVNKLFEMDARLIACGIFPLSGARNLNIHYVGNPVRDAVLTHEHAPVPSGPSFRILVFGGSQGASVFTNLMPQALDLLSPEMRARMHITQQVRAPEQEALERRYVDMGIKADLAPFFMDLPARMAGVHLVIARSGASTLAEIQIIGRAAILVPLPTAANNHQNLNAQAMVKRDAAFLFDETKDLPQRLADLIERFLNNPDLSTQMGDIAYEDAQSDSAIALLDLIVADLDDEVEG